MGQIHCQGSPTEIVSHLYNMQLYSSYVETGLLCTIALVAIIATAYIIFMKSCKEISVYVIIQTILVNCTWISYMVYCLMSLPDIRRSNIPVAADTS